MSSTTEILQQNRKHAEGLIHLLKLKEYTPIGVSYLKEKPTNFAKLDLPMAACAMIRYAAKEGKSFYMTADENTCVGGVFHVGLSDFWGVQACEDAHGLRTGEAFVKMGVYRTTEAGMVGRAINPKVPLGTFKALAFAPLYDMPFTPNVVVMICSPKQLTYLLQAWKFDAGETAEGHGELACGGALARPFLTGKMNYFPADGGARRLMGLQDNDMIAAIPGREIERVTRSLADYMKAFTTANLLKYLTPRGAPKPPFLTDLDEFQK